MFLVDQILLLGGALILVGIISSKISSRIGVPTLLLFIIIGMLAGSEGIGGLEFSDYEVAHAIGTIALAVILFDGGLQTSYSSVRAVWKPAGILATVGVILTALITGVAAVWWLDLPWYVGMLLGATVSSTDAAAVFSTLRNQGVGLDDHLSSTLEIESGANDPMAIFLTIGCIELITVESANLWSLSTIFLSQMIVGGLVGLLFGRLASALINRINLDAPGLYPVLALVMGTIIYGIAAFLQGSGFLAIYIAAMIIGNRDIVFRRGIFLFTDGIAWTAQIAMFTVMGLLVFPSSLFSVAADGIVIALVLILIARPLVVFLTISFFGFTVRELLFISWVGLKGAVPIILAIFPFLFGVEEASLLFNIVFFVVILSSLTQGWSLALVARLLGLDRPQKPNPPAMLEITSRTKTEAQIVDFIVESDVPAFGKSLRELPLPQGVLVAMISRDGRVRPPKASTVLAENDHVFIVVDHITEPLVERLFTSRHELQPPLPAKEVVFLDPSITTGQVYEYYAILLPCSDLNNSLEAFMKNKIDGTPQVGDAVDCGPNTLSIVEIENDRITSIGLRSNALADE